MKIELSSPAKITPYEHVFDLLGGSNSTLIAADTQVKPAPAAGSAEQENLTSGVVQ